MFCIAPLPTTGQETRPRRAVIDDVGKILGQCPPRFPVGAAGLELDNAPYWRAACAGRPAHRQAWADAAARTQARARAGGSEASQEAVGHGNHHF